jgi:hypothetical protein
MVDRAVATGSDQGSPDTVGGAPQRVDVRSLGWTVLLLIVGALGLVLWWRGAATQIPLFAGIGLAARWGTRRWGRWAGLPAAVILVVLCENVVLLLVASVLGGPLRSRGALLAQLTPVLVFAALDLWSARGPGPRPATALSGTALRWRLATILGVGVGPGLFVGALAVSWHRSPVGPLSWAMAGDAVNDVWYIRLAVAAGGVTLPLLHDYQLIPNALATAASAGPGRNGLLAGPLLEHDVAALAWSWATGIILIGVLAALIARWLTRGLGRRSALLATATGSLISLSGGVLGISVWHGFITASWGQAVLLSVVLLGLGLWDSRPDVLAALASLAALVETSTWTLMTAPCLALAGLAAVQALRRRFRNWLAWTVAVVGSGATLAMIGYLALSDNGTGGSSLASMAGAITTPPPITEVVVVALVVVSVLATVARSRPASAVTTLAVLAGGALDLLWLWHLGAGLGDYYPKKLLWMITCALLPVAVAAPVLVAARLWRSVAGIVALGWSRSVLSWVGGAAVGLLILVGSGLLSPRIASPVIPSWTAPVGADLAGQWSIPDAQGLVADSSVRILFNRTEANETVVFSRGPTPLSDITATAWVWHLVASHELAFLAYFSNLQDPAVVCNYVRSHRGFTVVTTIYGKDALEACGAVVSVAIDPSTTP